MKKIKQFADKAFVRSDKTEVLSEDLQEAERRIDLIKQSCESTAKKVSGCLQAQGKDSGAIDKRIRKVPVFALGSNMVTHGKNFSGTNSVLGEVLLEAGTIEMKLAQEMVEYEIKIEELILKPLQTFMDTDLPTVFKLKRTLSKLTENMDTARLKYQQANRSSSISGTSSGKIDSFKDEWEDSQQKVEQCRDHLASEMYGLIARESEISKYIVEFLNYQKNYHKQTYLILEELVPEVDVILKNSASKPSYGVDLEDHLKTTESKIAYPLELCICGLLEMAMEEEGLFRIAGSASKVKKLKSAFDAGLINLKALMTEFGDPHVIANALKCYLRELPSPLLTAELYDEWLAAVKTTDGQSKLQELWKVVRRLPTANQDNLRYLVKFLRELSKHQDSNKMSPVNIAIVIGPNLIWSHASTDEVIKDSSAMGLNMTMTHLYSSVLEQLITYADYFFPEDIDFFVTCTKPTELELNNVVETSVNATIDETNEVFSTVSIKRSPSTSSIEEHSPSGSPKPIRRRKNKPAPVPPGANSRNWTVNEKGPASMDVMKMSRTGSQKLNVHKMSQSKPEGHVWVPPSPSQMDNRKKMSLPEVAANSAPVNNPILSENAVKIVPPKPPQPQISRADTSDRSYSPLNNETLSKPLRHKSSFKVIGSSNVDKEACLSTDITSNSAPYIVDRTNAFSSLPRHFHTENYDKHPKAPRPPSIYAIGSNPTTEPLSLPHGKILKSDMKAPSQPPPGPPVPENQKKETVSEEKTVPQVEKVESEKCSTVEDSENVENSDPLNSNSQEQPGKETLKTSRPVPAPRSSLLFQSSSHNLPTTSDSSSEALLTNASGGGSKEKDFPIVKERPSLKAKPRDLGKKSHSANIPTGHNHKISESGGLSDSPECHNSHSSVESKNASHDPEQASESIRTADTKPEKAEEHGVYVGRIKPPRPQPPPKATTKPLLGESTDL